MIPSASGTFCVTFEGDGDYENRLGKFDFVNASVNATRRLIYRGEYLNVKIVRIEDKIKPFGSDGVVFVIPTDRDPRREP